jgi:outer membrane protein OmpA-like peptidoglycan-associated protein
MRALLLPMKKILLLSIFCVLFITSFSQPYDPSKINKKAIDLYQKAILTAESGNYTEAINLFNQSLTIEPKYIHAHLALGSIYGQMKNYKSSAEAYEKAFAIDSNYTLPDKLLYSVSLAWQGRFEQALAAVNSMLTSEKLSPNLRRSAENRKKNYEFAVDFAKKHSVGNYVFAPKNLGDSVNTTASEYLPSLTIDGKELIFTRQMGNEDFFSCTKKDNGIWTTAKPLTKINTPQNEGAQMISADGQWLVFTGCDRRDGYGGCDIYFSFLTTDGWSEPINAGPKINTDQWESQPCLSPDKKDLYFASRRLGGRGGMDIWVSHLVNGRWSDPENLGPQINTEGDEQCPFMHVDNQTLYFNSNKWPGYGDEDLFYSKKLPDGKWSTPVNLGYPINTIGTEATLFIAADGKTAYYASARGDSKGGMDIYSFELPENIRPAKTLWVKGKVFDKKTLKGLSSSVELIDLANKETISKIQTDEQGNYLVTLPVGKDYAFNVNRKGYLFYSDNFSLRQKAPDSTYEKNIPLQPIEANASIVLNNIFFETNKFELDPKSQIELDKLVQLLNDNPTVKIEISGHTDNVGKPVENLTLSNNRAKSVVSYLISKGIAAQRLVAKGWGETKPVADNKTEEGKAKNRRTELRVISR